MSEKPASKFERLLGENKEAFHLMVEGALKDWHGIYDVLMPDTQQYLLTAKQSRGFSSFCAAIRESPKGEDLCLKCDLQAAEDAEKYRQPIVYSCHAGLFDVVIPVVVKDELVAAILCGQVRALDEEWDAQGLEETKSLEHELGFADGTLSGLREEIPQVSLERLQEVAERVSTIARFVSQILETNAELQEANQRLRQSYLEQEQRRERNGRLLQAIAQPFSMSNTWQELWNDVEGVLEKLCELYEARHAVVLLHEIYQDGPKTTVKAAVDMRGAMSKGQVFEHDDLFSGWDDLRDVQRRRFDASVPNTVCWALDQGLPRGTPRPEYIVIARVHLTNAKKGLVAFFFGDQAELDSDPRYEETNLRLIASRVAQAYHNTDVYISQVVEEEQRRAWIRRISHQIIAPLNGLVGHAGSLADRFERWWQSYRFESWPKEDIGFCRNSLISMLWTADWAVRLTRNLAWTMDPRGDERELMEEDLETLFDVPDYIIEIARFVQGIARERGLHRVHVNRESLSPLSGRLRVYPDYFRDALMNLLDNAVKYSDKGTSIVVEGGLTSGHCLIRVTNWGICLQSEDCERIFDYDYRAPEARRRYPTGTGIGLSIAREIAELHGGHLTAKPSQETSQGWMTTFTISLPSTRRR